MQALSRISVGVMSFKARGKSKREKKREKRKETNREPNRVPHLDPKDFETCKENSFEPFTPHAIFVDPTRQL